MLVPRIAFPLLCAVVSVLAVPVAGAATTVGQTELVAADADSGTGGAGPCPAAAAACTIALLRDRAGLPAGMPGPGVLTRLRVRAAAGADGQVVVRVLRPAADGSTYAPVAAAAPVVLDGTGAAQSSDVRLPVLGGDVLAVRGTALPALFATPGGDGGHAVFGEPPTWSIGDAPRSPDPGALVPGDLLVAADLEPDADGDGAGDETQDACPLDPARTADCAVTLDLAAVAPAYEIAGRALAHDYVVRNRGAGPAGGVRVDLELLDGAELVGTAAPGGCTAAAGVRLRCVVGRLDPGESATVRLNLGGPAGAVARSAVRALAPEDPAAPTVTGEARTVLTGPSVAPAPRPFAAPACANVQTGNGDDEVLSGTSFGDRLLGRAGRDLLRGFAGDDCLEGGDGGDVLDGGDGSDRLAGADGNDRLQGGFGSDVLRGGLGRDVLVGGPGNDQLLPGPGADRVAAGDGDDVVDARDGIRETVDCGPGSDRARVDRRDRPRGCERVSRG